MKKVLFLGLFAAFLLFGGNGFCQGTSLTIIADNGEKFTLEINGSMHGSKARSRVTVTELFGPSIKVQVFIENVQVPPVAKTIANKPGSDFYYVLHRNMKGVYVIDRVNSDYVPSGKASSAPPATTEKAARVNETNEPKSSGKTARCAEPLSEEEFSVFSTAISARPFEGTKVSAAKKLVVDKCLTTAQVKELLYQFSQEPTRLDFAKFAYIHVHDPGNYGKIDEVFASATSVESLHRYIQSKK